MTAAIDGPEVLVADDEPLARELFRLQLESFGCAVWIAEDGHEAIALFRCHADRIPLVILDACMPGPAPQDIVSALRETNPLLAVVFCSGLSADDPELQFTRGCGVPVLPKPFRRSDLLEMLIRALGETEARVSALPHEVSGQ